jgi:hypothetical protein
MATSPYWPADFYPYFPDLGDKLPPLPVGKLAGIGGRADDESIVYCGSPIEGPGGVRGTLGCFVVLPGGQVGLLSTAHVLAQGGRAKVGDAVHGQGGRHQAIGTLHSFVNVRRGSHAQNTVDAAIALLSPGTRHSNGFAQDYQVPFRRWVRAPDFGERVFKIGAGSGLTYGEVLEFRDTLIDTEQGRVLFVNTICVGSTVGFDRFAVAGDSGALVVGEDGAPLGLVFAVAADGSYALACPMNSVCSALSCEVLAPLARLG